jgi:protein disulfide-isomerase A6
MILSVLVLLVECGYVEITSANIRSLIGGPNPILVKFYSKTCVHCKSMAADFSEAATAFTNVTFGGVECQEESKICKQHKVKSYPVIKLFPPKKRSGIEYKGDRSMDSFCDFVENHTTFKAKRPPKNVVDLNPFTLYETAEQTQCLFVTFYTPWCGHCKHWLPQCRIVADAMVPDKQVIIGRVDCVQFNDFCAPIASGYPTIKLFTGKTNVSYEGARTAAALIKFLNEHCGTERGVDGLLDDRAGLIPEANDIVRQFKLADDSEKASFVQKLKTVPNASFYVTVMQRYLAKGFDQLFKDRLTMEAILTARNGSAVALDGMKRRLNVFLEFMRPPGADPTPEPEPSPEPVSPVDTAPPESDQTQAADLGPDDDDGADLDDVAQDDVAQDAPPASAEEKQEDAKGGGDL